MRAPAHPARPGHTPGHTAQTTRQRPVPPTGPSSRLLASQLPAPKPLASQLLARLLDTPLGGGFLALAGRLTSPLSPDDYLALLDPLLSARRVAGRVIAVRGEGPGAATLVIRPGRGWAGHRAGQYLPVGVELDGVWHWRTYSLTSPPAQGTPLTITVKADPRGTVSPHLVRRTPPGTVLQLGPAQGEFTLSKPSGSPSGRRMLMVTAGSGITPVMGMLRTLARTREPGLDVVLLHSAPTPGESLFHAERTGMAATAPWFRLHEQHTRTAGRLTPQRIARLCPDWRSRETWACGPPALLDVIEKHWAAAGLSELLHVERFRLLPLGPPSGAPDAPGTPAARVRFERSGCEAESAASVPLLETGEAAGVAMPYGCRRGICFGCLAPLVDGRVRDLRTGRVHGSPGESIQTCVNAAAGPLVLDL